MWITTYHRFTNKAGFLAATKAAGWPMEQGDLALPRGVAMDMIGPLFGPPSVGEGGNPIAADVIDPRYHVNLAWHAQNMDAAFAASQVAPAQASRSFGIAPPVTPLPPVPPTISAWKFKAWMELQSQLAGADAVATASDVVSRNAWRFADTLSRDSHLMIAIAAEMRLSEDDIDDAFIAADQIKG